METLGSNRRTGRRSMLRGPATLNCAGVQVPARCWDLGLDGMCLLTKRPVSPGTRGTLSIDLPIVGVATTMTTEVKVIYSSYSGADGFKLGLVFIDLDSHTADLISACIDAA